VVNSWLAPTRQPTASAASVADGVRKQTVAGAVDIHAGCGDAGTKDRSGCSAGSGSASSPKAAPRRGGVGHGFAPLGRLLTFFLTFTLSP